ncbi:MAG: isochorismate synthase [Ignavibacteriales bacterium]|nr:MAG: isochorismate synthase [Ignavibacteriales bacterium]
MQDISTEIISSLNNFLAGSKSKIKDAPDGQVLINFIIPIPGFDFEKKIDSLSKLFPRSFYYNNPVEKFSFLALDEILTVAENGDGRFAATEKKLKGWREKFISNQSDYNGMQFPLFVGAMKFTVEHSDNDWKDFNDSTWFLPEIIFFKQSEKVFLIFNSLVPSTSSEDRVVKKLKSKLEIILKTKDDETSSVTIKAVSGNTPKDKKKWKTIVQQLIDKLEDGSLKKAVISRRVELQLTDEPSLGFVKDKLRLSNDGCYIFIYRNNKSAFFGASPELLLKLNDNEFTTGALAGSSVRGKDDAEDKQLESDLLKSDKNLREHNLVTEHIINSLKTYSGSVPAVEQLTVRKLKNIQHLYTRITCHNSSASNIFGLVKDLFPTPAVCGVPKETALNIIEDLETDQRGLYSGIIGWFNFNNSVELVVGIRSGLSIGSRVLAYSGAGIVPDSNPDEEYSETEIKLKSILSVFS